MQHIEAPAEGLTYQYEPNQKDAVNNEAVDDYVEDDGGFSLDELRNQLEQEQI